MSTDTETTGLKTEPCSLHEAFCRQMPGHGNWGRRGDKYQYATCKDRVLTIHREADSWAELFAGDDVLPPSEGGGQ